MSANDRLVILETAVRGYEKDELLEFLGIGKMIQGYKDRSWDKDAKKFMTKVVNEAGLILAEELGVEELVNPQERDVIATIVYLPYDKANGKPAAVAVVGQVTRVSLGDETVGEEYSVELIRTFDDSGKDDKGVDTLTLQAFARTQVAHLLAEVGKYAKELSRTVDKLVKSGKLVPYEESEEDYESE